MSQRADWLKSNEENNCSEKRNKERIEVAENSKENLQTQEENTNTSLTK